MKREEQVKNSQMVKKILDALVEHHKTKTLKGLALFIGVTPHTMYGWIRNGNIADTGPILAKTPNIRLGWLKSGEGDMFYGKSKGLVDIPPQSADNRVSGAGLTWPKGAVGTAVVPVLGRVRAGVPNQVDEDIEQYIGVPETIASPKSYAIRVVGNSMRRPDGGGVQDGDFVVFQLTAEAMCEPKHNSVVIVNDPYGDAMIRRLKISADGEWDLVSDNPAYEPIRANDGHTIVGVATGWVRAGRF